MYQGGCGEASAWKSVLLEAGTQLSLNLSGVHTFQFIREAVGRPQPGNLFLRSEGWNWNCAIVNLNDVHTFQYNSEVVGRPQHGELLLWRLGLSFR